MQIFYCMSSQEVVLFGSIWRYAGPGTSARLGLLPTDTVQSLTKCFGNVRRFIGSMLAGSKTAKATWRCEKSVVDSS